MRDLIHDLLNLARVTRSRLRLKTVDLSALAEAIAEDQKEADPKRTVEFVVRPDLVGRGDPNLLRVVLENLLENACKFSRSRDRPRVEFGCQEGNGNVFFVRDNGVGFEMARADRLFGAFQRLHGHEFEGTGIGLATVSRIIRRHGGRVWAEAKPDEGATFFFTLSRRQV